MSVCQLLHQFVDFYEIQYGGYATEGDLNAIMFNAVAATIPKRRTFELLRWLQICITQSMKFCILIDRWMKNF
jgi:hypothetical protein